MKAINNYIVIDKIKEEPKSASGFIITELQNEDVRYLKGKVISVGDLITGIKKNDIVTVMKSRFQHKLFRNACLVLCSFQMFSQEISFTDVAVSMGIQYHYNGMFMGGGVSFSGRTEPPSVVLRRTRQTEQFATPLLGQFVSTLNLDSALAHRSRPRNFDRKSFSIVNSPTFACSLSISRSVCCA